MASAGRGRLGLGREWARTGLAPGLRLVREVSSLVVGGLGNRRAPSGRSKPSGRPGSRPGRSGSLGRCRPEG